MLDSMMFLRHNIADWREPADFAFEPSPVYYDNDAMVTDEPAKNFLRNYLTKSKGLLGEYRRELETRRREVENARRVRKAIREGKDKRDEVEVVRAIFSLQENAHEAERQKVTAEVEVSTITSAVGDVSIGARNHNFKSQTFKIPTNCDYCGDRIWGLSAKGFDCRDCGYTCHSKCEMKAPADCPGEQTKEEKKALKAQRQSSAQKAAPTNGAATDAHSSKPSISRSDTVNSMNTLSSGYSATAQRSISGTAATPPVEEPQPERTSTIKASPSRRSRILAPPPTSYIKDSSDGAAETRTAQPRGRMTYPYQANGEGEISVSEGSNVVIVEPDGEPPLPFSSSSPLARRPRSARTNPPPDGSGWLRVTSGSSTGLVPASYVELTPTANSTPPPSAHATRPHSTYSNNSSVSLAGSHVSASGASSSGGTLKKKGPAVAPKRGAKKLKYVEALYEYEARSEAEHSMKEGERFVLISPDSGDGWADVEKGGRVASVPANYVQEV